MHGNLELFAYFFSGSVQIMAVKSTGVTQDGVSVATGRSRRKHSLVVFIGLATQLIGHAS